MEWHKDHPDALLDDMQLFLRTQCGIEVSLPTVSRQLRKAYGGTLLRNGRCARIRSRKQREAEGRSIALELQQFPGGDDSSSNDNNNSGDQTPAPEVYHDQRRLAPLEQIVAPQHAPPAQDGQGTAFHGGVGQQFQDAVSAS